MNIKKFILFIFGLFALALPFDRFSFKVAHASSDNQSWINTADNVVESNEYYGAIYLNTHEDISALSISIHYDSDVFLMSEHHGVADNCTMYDCSGTGSSFTYTFIFDNISKNEDQRLIYFYYLIKENVTPGKYYFDLVVNEAYNSSLEDVTIVAKRKYIDVASIEHIKSVNTYISSGNNISASYEETITFTYELTNSEPTSGVFVLAYDNELFEFVSLTKHEFFDNMICDYNASLTGQILISFAEAVPDDNQRLFTVSLKVIKNISKVTDITLNASELYDTGMSPMSLNSDPLHVSLLYDPNYDEHPSVTTTSVINTANHQVIFTINLEENSHLGAADFVFKFDKSVLTYVGSEKLISPTFFTVNDKAAQLEQGQIKFSILSTTDITDGGDILRLTFSYVDIRNDRISSALLTGSGLTDSLTNPIQLDISGTEFIILGVDLVAIWIDTYMYMDDPSFSGEGTGRCISDNLYETAKRELLKLDAESISDFESDSGNKYTAALARYLAWANANHDNNPFELNFDFLSSSYLRLATNQYGSLIVVGIIIATTIIISVGCFILIRKKKNN